MPERLATSSSILTPVEKLCCASLLVIIAALLIVNIVSVIEGRALYALMILFPLLVVFVATCCMNATYLQNKLYRAYKKKIDKITEQNSPLLFPIIKTTQDALELVAALAILIGFLGCIFMFSTGIVFLIESF